MPFIASIDGAAVEHGGIEPDAHGQAALLLTESLVHTLVGKHILTNRDAIDLIQVAADVKVEVATAAGESETRMRESLALLSKMAESFKADAAEENTRAPASRSDRQSQKDGSEFI
jgi:hypothetical protein